MSRKTALRAHAAADRQEEETLLGKAKRHIRQENYVAALQLLGAGGHDWELKNARGVCLLRMGRHVEALQFFRGMLLRAGCVIIRPDLPTYLKGNYATALLMAGQVEGCLQTLTAADDERSPIVIRLRQCLRAWEKRLTLGQWFGWKFGTFSPGPGAVPLDFLPGVFADGLVEDLPKRPAS